MLEKKAKLYSISEVVEKLQKDYSKLTKSMIRFWEKEGLLFPGRTIGGHRTYKEKDLIRMNIIADLRQKKYLPLSVVKHIIEKIEEDPTYDFQLFEEFFRPEEFDPKFQPLNWAQMKRKTDISEDDLDEIQNLGFLEDPGVLNQALTFDQVDAQILIALMKLKGLGLSPQDLKFMVQDVKAHLKNEAQMWKKILANLNQSSDKSAKQKEILGLSSKIRSLIYKKYAGQIVGSLIEPSSNNDPKEGN